MKLVGFNINSHVRVKMTSAGKVHGPQLLIPDADGYVRMQLWQVMQYFGPHVYLGCNPPIETTVLLELPDQEIFSKT